MAKGATKCGVPPGFFSINCCRVCEQFPELVDHIYCFGNTSYALGNEFNQSGGILVLATEYLYCGTGSYFNKSFHKSSFSKIVPPYSDFLPE